MTYLLPSKRRDMDGTNRFILLALFTVTVCFHAACKDDDGLPEKPRVVCDATPTPGNALLCIKAVALRLGPADGIEGYDPITGMRVMLLPTGAVDLSGTAFVLSAEAADSLIRAAIVGGSTDARGELHLDVEPGKYEMFAVFEDREVIGRTVFRNEVVVFPADQSIRYLISFSPWGGYLAFEAAD
ncbi:MAG: hypothetical protein HOH43_25940 [Candidatus Latescibacteria bacterium]|jgi:hypothetical protein|nr:hypothetical protein [Candidatus Latescibacterota bacterium]